MITNTGTSLDGTRYEIVLVAKDLPGSVECFIESAAASYAACKEFCRKVECGKAVSTESYAQMKAVIAKAETP